MPSFKEVKLFIYFTKQYDKQYEHVQNDALNKFTTFAF